LNGTEVVYLETASPPVDPPHLPVGRTLPAYATALGKALLAELTDDEVCRLVPHDPAGDDHQTPSPTGTCCWSSCPRCASSATRPESEEGTLGVRCVGAAVKYRIPAHRRAVLLTVGRRSHETAVQVGELLVAAATELGNQLQRPASAEIVHTQERWARDGSARTHHRCGRRIGHILRPRLAADDRVLRLFDIAAVEPAADGEAVEVVTGSVTDPAVVSARCEGVDAIIHLGGHSRRRPGSGPST